MAAGVTLNPGTPLGQAEIVAGLADNLLCMSVNPGWGGQSFIPSSLERLTALRALARPGAGVEIDGGVGRDDDRRLRPGGREPLHGRLRDLLRARPCRRVPRPRGARARCGGARVGLTTADEAYLDRTLELAERGRRTAAPNPEVGCVLVRDGAVVGEGFHVRPGTAHAEIVALAAAGDAARGATAYVSLEPCAHHGPHAAVRRRADRRRRDARRRRRARPVPRGRRRRASRALRAAGVEVAVADPAIAHRRRRAAPERRLPHRGHPRPAARHLQGGGHARRPHGVAHRRRALDLLAREPRAGARVAGRRRRRAGRQRHRASPTTPR